MSGPSRRGFVPEVVQTSSMDCGPAALKSALEGLGISASYGRLREACQTEVDGTSIDTLEELAGKLGLSAEQTLLPTDFMLTPAADALPAIAVLRTPAGINHFVVVWRVHGPLVQIMDPESGRRFMQRDELLRSAYVHEMAVPAEAVRDWLASDQIKKVFDERLSRIGARGALGEALERARKQPGPEELASIDAALRMVTAMVHDGALRRGAESASVLRLLVERAKHEGTRAVPDRFWTARPTGPSEDGGDQVLLRGALIMRILGRRDPQDASEPAPPLSSELGAVLTEPPTRPLRELMKFVAEGGLLTPLTVGWALILAMAGAALEVMLLRTLFNIGQELPLVGQRAGAMLALLCVLLTLFALEIPIALGALRLGRALETRLRMALLYKLPRLGDRYLQSRPLSDMAERSHSLHGLRAMPELAARAVRISLEMVAACSGLIWLDRGAAPLVAAAIFVMLGCPWLVQKRLSEADLRLRTHAGALTSFYLDALMGLVPVRAHGAAPSLGREHEARLSDWWKAGIQFVRAAVNSEVLTSSVGAAAALLLLGRAITHAPDARALLLQLYWTLSLPMLAQELASLLRRFPMQRNLALRLLEPLGAREEQAVVGGVERLDRAPALRDESSKRGVAIRLDGVGVLAAGHQVLRDLTCEVAAGEHVAVVGASGAGKSSLAGLLLGFHRASSGRVWIDGEPLEAAVLEELRQRCAWIDPQVQLWNRSLFENLVYGSEQEGELRTGQAIEDAELRSVLQRMPDGLQTRLGEGGALVSGGEGQRVRLARALLREDARLVILDEAFRGLDGPARRRLLARTRERFADATLICVTHDLADTAAFQRVIVIEQGTIVEDDAPAQLLQRSDSRYRALVEAERALTVALRGPALQTLRLDEGKLEQVPHA